MSVCDRCRRPLAPALPLSWQPGDGTCAADPNGLFSRRVLAAEDCERARDIWQAKEIERLSRRPAVRVWPDAPEAPCLAVIHPWLENKEVGSFVGKIWPDGRICFAGRKPPGRMGNKDRWLSLEDL